jgi:hypothetical protein
MKVLRANELAATVALAALALWAGQASSQLTAPQLGTGELVIGHIHLRLGMKAEDVLPQLTKEFVPRQVSEREGKYLLWTKDSSGLPHSAGSVSFSNGRLYRATKTWADEPADSPATARELFSALEAFAGKEGKAAKVKAGTFRAVPRGSAAGTQVKLITIEFPPDRRFEMRFYESLPAPGERPFEPSTSVEETLGELTPH